MASLGQIRQGLADTVSTHLDELNVYGTVADVTQVPALVVMPHEAEFSKTFNRGLDEWTFNLVILVGRQETQDAQLELDAYVTGGGEKSVRRVLYQYDDLGLSDGTTVFVQGMPKDIPYGGSFATAAIDHVGAALRVVVRTPGGD